jgi:hypothetical protein
MEHEISYYRRRSAEEASAASAAPDPHVRNVHLELCRQYQQRVVALEAQLPRAKVQLVGVP